MTREGPTFAQLCLSLAAGLASAAFAPAPFSKPDRERGPSVLPNLEGTWSTLHKQRIAANGEAVRVITSQKVLIQGGRWWFLSAAEARGKVGAAKRSGYRILTEPRGSPRAFRLRPPEPSSSSGGEDYLSGYFLLQDDVIRIAYRLGSGKGEPEVMPSLDLKTAPEGWYLLTLRRDD